MRGKTLTFRKPSRAQKAKRMLLWIAIVLIILIGGGYGALRWMTYAPSQAALQALSSGATVTVEDEKGWIALSPSDTTALMSPSVIFYPGALVAPESYAPWAEQVARAGHRVYIVKMPLNLAVLGQNKADEIINAHPNETFVIGGHSLGGAMAARYAAEENHAAKLAGVFFLAAYADDKGSLRDTGLPALQLTGSSDGVLTWQTWEADKTNLPADKTTYVSIEGGNHAQFGSYGHQRGDNTASISEEEQHKQIATALVSWLAPLK